MTNYIIGAEFIRDTAYSSLGVQRKYEKDGYWYKENIAGCESQVEAICSFVLENSSVDDFVRYEQCQINGKAGCRSRDFLSEGEEFLTFQRLYDFHAGGQLSDKIYEYREVADRIEYTLDFLYSVTELDLRGYLQESLTLDMVTLNIDRHFHNLGVLKTATGYRKAPIFDNGAALFSNYSIFPMLDTLEENMERVIAKPFSGSFEQQAVEIGLNLSLDYEKIYEGLEEHFTESRAKKVLKYQMQKYESVIPQLRE